MSSMEDRNTSNPLGDAPQSRSIPSDVLDAITAARLDDIAISWGGHVHIDKQIIKADSISLQVDAQIILPYVKFPWIAFVAKRLYIQTPNLHEAQIIAPKVELLQPYNPTDLGQAGQGNAAPAGEHGPAGSNGINASNAEKGRDGLRIPTLYLIAGEVLTWQNTAPPFVYFGIDLRGWDASRGQNGQTGQRGGRGGTGGPGIWNGYCVRDAGRGGPGGMGGNGGAGGAGGDGSNGGSLLVAGSEQTIRALRFVTIAMGGGKGGPPGWPGSNGRFGIGGAGGARPVTCGGGGDGADGLDNSYVAVDLGSGKDGVSGTVGVQVLDVGSLFPRASDA